MAGGQKCHVIGCTNNRTSTQGKCFSKTQRISYHRFPRAEKWREKWIQVLLQYNKDQKFAESFSICSAHFTPNFLRAEDVVDRGLLSFDAVPSIFPPLSNMQPKVQIDPSPVVQRCAPDVPTVCPPPFLANLPMKQKHVVIEINDWNKISQPHDVEKQKPSTSNIAPTTEHDTEGPVSSQVHTKTIIPKLTKPLVSEHVRQEQPSTSSLATTFTGPFNDTQGCAVPTSSRQIPLNTESFTSKVTSLKRLGTSQCKSKKKNIIDKRKDLTFSESIKLEPISLDGSTFHIASSETLPTSQEKTNGSTSAKSSKTIHREMRPKAKQTHGLPVPQGLLEFAPRLTPKHNIVASKSEVLIHMNSVSHAVGQVTVNPVPRRTTSPTLTPILPSYVYDGILPKLIWPGSLPSLLPTWDQFKALTSSSLATPETSAPTVGVASSAPQAAPSSAPGIITPSTSHVTAPPLDSPPPPSHSHPSVSPSPRSTITPTDPVIPPSSTETSVGKSFSPASPAPYLPTKTSEICSSDHILPTSSETFTLRGLGLHNLGQVFKPISSAPNLPTHTPESVKQSPRRQLSLLCRICGGANHPAMVDIFGRRGRNIKLPEMIKVLPVKVRKDDGLPQSMCQRCVQQLTAASLIVRNCQRTERRFKKLISQRLSSALHALYLQPTSVLQEPRLHKVALQGPDARAVANDHSYLGQEDSPRLKEHLVSDDGEEDAPMEDIEDSVMEEPLVGTTSPTPSVRSCSSPPAPAVSQCPPPAEPEDALKLPPFPPAPTPLVCDQCPDFHTRNIPAYLQHQFMEHLRRSLVSCLSCPGLVFSHYWDFIQHAKQLHSDVTCTGVTYIDIWIHKRLNKKLIVRASKPTGDKFTCKLCNIKFIKLVEFLQHKSRHDDILECHYCGHISKSKLGHREHLKFHRKRKCDYCTFVSKDEHELAGHVETEHQDILSPYTCDHCSSVFPNQNYLALHQRREHPVDQSLHLCSICGVTFTDAKKYKKHTASHLPLNESGSMECTLCDTLICGSNFLPHMCMHLKIKPFTCSLCQKGFFSEEFLTRHEEVHLTRKRFDCAVCNISFDSMVSLSTHRNKHAAKKNGYVCLICQVKVPRFEDLINHSKHHSPAELEGVTNVYLFKCSKCPQTFTSQYCYSNHSSSAQPPEIPPEERTAILTCNLCLESFDDVREFVTHKKSHPEAFKLTCHHCDERFNSRRTRDWHDKIHHMAATRLMLTCEMCSRAFISQKALERHKKLFWCRKIDKPQHVCTVCDKKFNFAIQLESHSITHSVSTKLECQICSRSFTYSTSYRSHMLSHTNRDRYKCESCSYVTYRKDHLRNHIICKHETLRPYQCDICLKTFKQRSSMTGHRTIHTHGKSMQQIYKERKTGIVLKQDYSHYQCEICQAKFNNVERYQIHKISFHNSSEVFTLECTDCPFTCTDAKAMKNHKRKHGPNKNARFSCDHCGRKFNSQAFCEKHMATHSSEFMGQFRCDACLKYFFLKRELKIHVEQFCTGVPENSAQVHDKYNQRLRCPKCSKCYMKKNYLALHLKKCGV